MGAREGIVLYHCDRRAEASWSSASVGNGIYADLLPPLAARCDKYYREYNTLTLTRSSIFWLASTGKGWKTSKLVIWQRWKGQGSVHNNISPLPQSQVIGMALMGGYQALASGSTRSGSILFATCLSSCFFLISAVASRDFWVSYFNSTVVPRALWGWMPSQTSIIIHGPENFDWEAASFHNSY